MLQEMRELSSQYTTRSVRPSQGTGLGAPFTKLPAGMEEELPSPALGEDFACTLILCTKLGGGLAMGSNSLLTNSNSKLEFVDFLGKFRIGLPFRAYICDTFPNKKTNKALHQNKAKTENMYPYSKDKKH